MSFPDEKKIVPLDQMPKPPEVETIEKTAEWYANRFISNAQGVLKELEAGIKEMEMADHYNRTRTAEDMLERKPIDARLMTLAAGAIEKEGEAGLRRTQLLLEVSQLFSELIRLTAGVKDAVINIETSKKVNK